jgi:hypothetical protein
MLKQAMAENRFDKNRLTTYPEYIRILDYFNDLQIKNKIVGNIAEIGVANGAFFVPLSMCCREDECAIAIDVFEDRQKNWNPYGGSSGQDIIKRALSANGSNTDVRFIKGDSFHITASMVLEAGSGDPVRLFSVDGSHSTHHTVHDLQIAGEVASEGAVVFLDDVKNWGWPGAIEGFARYSLLQPQPRLVPFMLCGNKFMLTPASSHRMMFETALAYTTDVLKRENEKSYRISTFFGWSVVGF